VPAEQLGHGEDEVGRGDALLKSACKFEAYDLWDEHVVGLAEHHGLRLDPADTPAEDAEAIDHGGVAVGAYQRVRHRHPILDLHDPGEILEVDLMDDAGRRRYHGEVVESLLAPFQELVSLAVALELALGVELKSSRRAEGVHLDGVVDNQVGWHQRVDLLGVPPDRLHRAPHRGQVHDSRNPCEVLHHDPRRKIS
jgi:hypothetical protein